MDILTKVLLGLLTLDTIRAVIAMLGWVKPESKIAWIIYGRYDRNLIISALQDMGYTHEKREKIIRGMKKLQQMPDSKPVLLNMMSMCNLLFY